MKVFLIIVLFFILFLDILTTWGGIGLKGCNGEIKRCEFFNFYTSKNNNGGCFYLEIEDSKNILFEDCNFINCGCEYGGGNGEGRGGSIYAFSTSSTHNGFLKIHYCNFTYCKSKEGGSIFSSGIIYFYFYFYLIFIFYI
jgi:hypothetical protein